MSDTPRIDGRHLAPADLRPVAAHLGDPYGAPWVAALHAARLDIPHPGAGSCIVADFLTPRLEALRRRSGSDTPGRGEITWTIGVLHAALEQPVAFYKDCNPRNVLITTAGRVVTIDFDDLTLAPFGYDLAKLVVTLAMTHGPIPADAIKRALDAYNAAARHAPHLRTTSYPQLLDYAEIHHVLTARYLGQGGYRHPWSVLHPHAAEGDAS